MKASIPALLAGIIILACACNKDKNTIAPVDTTPTGKHTVQIQLSGSAGYASLISFRPKGNTKTDLVLLDSVRQNGTPYVFKKDIADGDHLVIRLQGDSTFSADYEIDDNAVTKEKGNYQITGKSTNGKNSIIVFQYPDEAQ